MEKEKFPICPVCGMETDTYYYNWSTGEIVGCGECITSTDAWDTQSTDRI